MRRRERLMGLLVILALVAAVKLVQEVYRWYAYADERARIHQLTTALEEAGLEVIRTQVAADSLRAQIERTDRDLSDAKRAVTAYGGHAVNGALPAHLYESYRRELDDYNGQVVERNSRFEEWKAVVARNHGAVQRYNDLADSIRAIAEAIGEPYYPVPSPAEIALQKGMTGPPR